MRVFLVIALALGLAIAKPNAEKLFAYNGPSMWGSRPAPAPACTGFWCWAYTPAIPIGSPAPAPGPAPATNTAQFQQDILKATNEKRNAECTGPLTQDSTLATAAQKYADQMASTGVFQHSSQAINGQYGENLAVQCGGTFSGGAAVNAWYNEKQYFNKANPVITDSENVNGHYTALVWKETTNMGCGTATRNGCTYIACNYLPQGNNPATAGANVGC